MHGTLEVHSRHNAAWYRFPANVAPKASMAAKNEKSIQTDKSTCSRGHTSLEQFLCIRAAFWELHHFHYHNFFVNMHNFLHVVWQPQVCWNMPEYIQVAWMLPEEHFTSFPSKRSHIKQVHMSSYSKFTETHGLYRDARSLCTCRRDDRWSGLSVRDYAPYASYGDVKYVD